MIWIEKYKPKSFAEITSHQDIVNMMSSYTLETIPNIIIHGQHGHNKKTAVYCLIEKLYGKYPQLKQKTIEIEAGTTKLEVNYLECDEVVEIWPSEYGYRDRQVSQSIIKEMAQTKPILSMFGSKKHKIKILIIDQAEDLSRDAQASLRRTIEIYSGHFRIIMICSEISKLIEPIRSRCLLIRMRGFTFSESETIAKSILEKEKMDLNNDILKSIILNSNGDIKRMICILEICCYNGESNDNKRLKPDMSGFRLDWESKVDNIVDLIKNSPKIETMAAIRKEIYDLLGSCIPPSVILLEMFKVLSSKGSFNLQKALIPFALGYDERIRLGTKPLYHLEAFAAFTMQLINSDK